MLFQQQGYLYAPDPSSQPVCTIGGNVADSGGAHCLKYGFTVTHVMGLEVVLPSGELVTLGNRTLDATGYSTWPASSSGGRNNGHRRRRSYCAL